MNAFRVIDIFYIDVCKVSFRIFKIGTHFVYRISSIKIVKFQQYKCVWCYIMERNVCILFIWLAWNVQKEKKQTKNDAWSNFHLVFMLFNALILPERKWHDSLLINGAESRKKNPFDMYFPYGPSTTCVLCTYTLTNTETNKQTLPWHQFKF